MVVMDSDIKRNAVRLCLAQFAASLKENGKNAIVVNDTNIEFYEDVAASFQGLKFDYISLAFEDAFAFCAGLLEVQTELGQESCMMLFADHSSAHRISPFTINDLMQRGQDVNIVLFEQNLAKKFYYKHMYNALTQGKMPMQVEEAKKPFFNYRHTFLSSSFRMHAAYLAQASAAFESDLSQKAASASNPALGSLLVIHSPAEKEDEDLEMMRQAVECGYVMLFERSAKGNANITYMPKFSPSIEEFLKTAAFFEGITDKQVADLENHLERRWEEAAPGKFRTGGAQEETRQPKPHAKKERGEKAAAEEQSAAVERLSYSKQEEKAQSLQENQDSQQPEGQLDTIGQPEGEAATESAPPQETAPKETDDDKPIWATEQEPIAGAAPIDDEVEKVEYHPPKKKYKKDAHGK